MHPEFTVGTDQEVFLQKDGSFISAVPLIRGTKHNPEQLPSGGHIQHDNVAMEFATPPVTGEDEFVKTIRQSLLEAMGCLPQEYEAFVIASTDFPEEELQSLGAKEFGCDPDFDAWRICQNETPDSFEFPLFRSCGGHLHIGYLDGSGNEFLQDFEGRLAVVKALDIFVGIPFTILDSSPESLKRRKLYGKAGCHRPTEYGVEYRALSNFWLKSPKLVRLIHKLTSLALNVVKQGKIADIISTLGEDNIQNIINEGDVHEAIEVLSDIVSTEVNDETKELFNACLKGSWGTLKEEWQIK